MCYAPCNIAHQPSETWHRLLALGTNFDPKKHARVSFQPETSEVPGADARLTEKESTCDFPALGFLLASRRASSLLLRFIKLAPSVFLFRVFLSGASFWLSLGAFGAFDPRPGRSASPGLPEPGRPPPACRSSCPAPWRRSTKGKKKSRVHSRRSHGSFQEDRPMEEASACQSVRFFCGKVGATKVLWRGRPVVLFLLRGYPKISLEDLGGGFALCRFLLGTKRKTTISKMCSKGNQLVDD